MKAYNLCCNGEVTDQRQLFVEVDIFYTKKKIMSYKHFLPKIEHMQLNTKHFFDGCVCGYFKVRYCTKEGYF